MTNYERIKSMEIGEREEYLGVEEDASERIGEMNLEEMADCDAVCPEGIEPGWNCLSYGPDCQGCTNEYLAREAKPQSGKPPGKG